MTDRWNDQDAPPTDDLLAQRVYTSRLLGIDASLVLHGGGNTSVKIREPDFFGTPTDVLYVKGSGWNLATIEAPGFAPVRMDALLRLAELDVLSDSDMVRQQRVALLDPSAPNPSVEAILHAIIPYRFVDHTHADAIVAMTNTPDGEAWVRDLFGPRMLIVPYVMPGFELCKQVARQTRDQDWSSLDGMILLNHGIFTFADDARSSYEAMVSFVDRAEQALTSRTGLPVRDPDAGSSTASEPRAQRDALTCARVRHALSTLAERPMFVTLDRSPIARALADRPDVSELAPRGPATPDHVIRTKPHAAVLTSIEPGDVERAVQRYATDYRAYVARHAGPETKELDPAPRWIVLPGAGHLAAGPTLGHVEAVRDIARHTADIAIRAEAAGGWRPLPDGDLFAVEYWELEQAKLSRGSAPPPLAGKVALVTGAANGIGRATAHRLRDLGAAVIALDVDPSIEDEFADRSVLPVPCDVTDADALEQAVLRGVETFGGLDIVVSNAGVLPPSRSVADFDLASWQASLDVNLTATARLVSICAPFLRLGIGPSIIVTGSKNVPAPGIGAAAYSSAKAALTQWARVAALELASDGIRVNVVHPDAVFDTALWTDAALKERSDHYGLTVEEYKTRNLLGVEVTSADVAGVVAQLASDAFRVVTGAQVPVDGGNDRVV